MDVAVGLDFGTTNSAIGWVGGDGAPVLASFSAAGEASETRTFRSVLYFDRGEDGQGRLAVRAGPEAIARYLAAEEKNGRLVQSLKSFLASRLFTSTAIFGTTFRIEDLAAHILRPLREAASSALGAPVDARGVRAAGALRPRRGRRRTKRSRSRGSAPRSTTPASRRSSSSTSRSARRGTTSAASSATS